jgi:hypothetical protein
VDGRVSQWSVKKIVYLENQKVLKASSGVFEKLKSQRAVLSGDLV